MLRHELVDRGNAEEDVDAHRWIADQLQRRARIERAQNGDGAADVQHRIGVAIQSAGVKQRQYGEQHRRRRNVGKRSDIDAVEERHAVRDDRALRPSGSPGGVHDGRDVIERDDLDLAQRRSTGDGGLVAISGAECQRGRHAGQLLYLVRDRGQFVVMQHQLRRGVGDNEFQLGHGEAIVERHEHRAQPPARELHFHRVGGVQRQHRDAVAARDTLRVLQMLSEARDAIVQRCVAQAPIAREIDQCDLARRAPRVMRDPVVVTHGHHTPPRPLT